MVKAALCERDGVCEDACFAFSSAVDVDLGDAVDSFEEWFDLCVERVVDGGEVVIRVFLEVFVVEVEDDPRDGVRGVIAVGFDDLWFGNAVGVVWDLTECIGDFL